MRQAYSALTRLDETPPTDVTNLRALEANAAAAYFRAWRGIPIKWRGTSRRPIPEASKRNRTAHIAISTRRKSQCRASDQCDVELRLCGPSKPDPDQCGC